MNSLRASRFHHSPDMKATRRNHHFPSVQGAVFNNPFHRSKGACFTITAVGDQSNERKHSLPKHRCAECKQGPARILFGPRDSWSSRLNSLTAATFLRSGCTISHRLQINPPTNKLRDLFAGYKTLNERCCHLSLRMKRQQGRKQPQQQIRDPDCEQRGRERLK